MLVLDHPTHQATSHKSDKPYGCTDKAFASGYYLYQRRYYQNGEYVMQPTFIEHKLSTQCRYDGSMADKRCAGCNHRGNGEDYVKQVTAR